LHVEDTPWAHLAKAVTVAAKGVEEGLGAVLQRSEPSDEVPEQVRDPYGDVSLVAGGEHEVAAFVEDVAERYRASPSVAALPAYIGILFGQRLCLIGHVGFSSGQVDGYCVEGDAEVTCEYFGVG
jgi:hypothetical protein